MTISRKKILLVSGSVIIFLVLIYIVFSFIPPFKILQLFKIEFNSPEKINKIFFKQLNFLLILSLLFFIGSWLYYKDYFQKFKHALNTFLDSLYKYFNLKLLFIICIIYLIILFIIAITHYDLGYDEAWYIHWAKNFSATGIASYYTDGKISIIDTITMLPYYILSPVLFYSGAEQVWQFKLFSTILSIISLILIYYICRRIWNSSVAIVAMFFIIIQPGFGFVASSFFGELLQTAFLLSGLYLWLARNKDISNKDIYLSAILFTIAIHTKFQLIILLFLTLLVLGIMSRETKALKVLLYTFIFTLSLGILRVLPVVISDPSQIRYLLVMDWVSGNSFSQSFGFIALEKFQLLNRFFSVALISIIMLLSPVLLRKAYEKFLYIFSAVCVLWWLFLFPYSTYRHPFIFIITLCLLASVLAVNLYKKITDENIIPALNLRYLLSFILFFIMMYGFTANLIYAYIGYNDGVQFDLDGYKNRLFSPIIQDNTQKEFYDQVKMRTLLTDTLYGSSFVTRFYLKNPVASLNAFKNIFNSENTNEKYLLITRENYPLGFQNIYKELDSLGFKKRLIIKIGENELFKINR